MDAAKAIERYGIYYHPIRKLAEFPLTHAVTIDELNIPRALVQRAYKEMKREDFDSNLIDYLCYVSTQFVIVGSKEALKERMQSKSDETERLILQISGVLTLEASKHNVTNLLRLHRRNPFYFQEAFLSYFEEDDYREAEARLLICALLDYAWTQIVMQQNSDIIVGGLIEKELNELALKEYVETVVTEVIEETSGADQQVSDAANFVNRK